MSAARIGPTGPKGGDLPDRDAALERRYLRLLRCYPPSHRELHGEEMLGVLVDAARPGQRVPGAAQTVNLAVCGLAIRGRRALAGGPWQDALAVVSLIAPVLTLVMAVPDFAVAVRDGVAVQQAYPAVAATPFWRPELVPRLGGPAAVMIGWLVVVVLALTGRRRAAAAIACVPLAATLAELLAQVMQRTGAWSGGLPMFLFTAGGGPVILASLAACSLAFSAGPRRGLAIAGWRRACQMIAVLSVVFGYAAVVTLVSPDPPLGGPVFSLLDVLALVIAVAVTRKCGTAGGRVAVLIATGLVIGLVGGFPFAGSLTDDLVVLLGNLLFAVLVWPVAVASWRGRGGLTATH